MSGSLSGILERALGPLQNQLTQTLRDRLTQALPSQLSSLLPGGIDQLSGLTGYSPAMIQQGRAIGKIIPDVAIEESHVDRVQVTQHPVAFGTPVSDHAFRMPATVTMRCGWTNSKEGASRNRVKETYDTLRDYMGRNEKKIDPITITTAKRTYENMIMTELTVKTDNTQEFAMIIEAQFQEVIRVHVRKTTQPAQAQLTDAPRTDATTDAPPKQADPIPVDNNSIERKLIHGPNAPGRDTSKDEPVIP
jgi:hypothetical protein